MRWRSMRELVLLLALAMLASACTKTPERPTTPEAALELYVKAAFSARTEADRQKLLELSVSDARAHLEQMSPEEFKQRFAENDMQLISMKARDLREEKSGDVSLVYEIAFKEGKAGGAASYMNKKIAYLTKDDKGDWKIKATKNVKSYVERKDDLEILTPETTSQDAPPAK